jgi:exopolysaccharide biosynthesis polyprenyl glycosylphosphotransferase
MAKKMTDKVGLFSGLKQYLFMVLFFSDAAMFFLSVVIGSRIMGEIVGGPYLQMFLFTLLILAFNYIQHSMYREKRNLFDENEFMGILFSNLKTFLIMTIFILLFTADMFLIVLTALILLINIILTTISRLIIEKIVLIFRARGYDQKKVIFFGKSRELLEKLKDSRQLCYKVVMTTESLDELKKNLGRADVVFINKPVTEDLMNLMIANDRVNWKIISSVFNLIIEPVAFDEFKDYPVINIRKRTKSWLTMSMKRLMDILLSASALIILSPVLILIALLIKVTMPGPVFFRQERIGKNLKPFRIFKFRTMVKGADKQKKKMRNEVNGLFKMKNDPRVTPLGRFLRRTCLDEIVQLFNILLGDMSIVGPRPHLRRELVHFSGWRKQRFKVKPGLTGMWQVNGRHELNFDKAILYDIYYIRHISVRLDILIILKTVPSIIFSRGRF